MLLPLVAALALTAPDAPAKKPSLLLLPIDARNGVSPDLAEQLVPALGAELARRFPVRVTTYKEIQGAITNEQLKQVANCDNVSCVAEIAGALNTDQIVAGTLGKFGDAYLLSLARVAAGNVEPLARVSRRYSSGRVEQILDDLPNIADELMGLPASAPLAMPEPPPAAPATPAPAPGEKPGLRPAKIGAWSAAGVGAALGALALLGGVALGLVGAGIVAHDASLGGRPGKHAIDAVEGLGADVAGVGAVVLGGVALVILVVAVGAFAASWVL